jgi:peroxiredoxin
MPEPRLESATICAAPALPPARSRTSVRRSGLVEVAVKAPAVGIWMGVKHLLAPVLYLPFRLGVPTCWAYRIDAYVKRTILPLTELPDERILHDVMPRIQRGDFAPRTKIRHRGEALTLYEVAEGRPLLLILFRGSWCSYSRLHLADVMQYAEQFRQCGIEILAVSSRRDERWWKSQGVDVPLAADRDGLLFEALGVKAPPSFTQQVWGTLVPHESMFLFDSDRRLIASDVRMVSNVHMKQRFSSAKIWPDLFRQEHLR